MNVRLIAFLSFLGLLAVGIAAYAGPFSLFSRPAPAPPWRSGQQDVRLTVEVDPQLDTPS
jgi:hypothetical protein